MKRDDVVLNQDDVLANQDDVLLDLLHNSTKINLQKISPLISQINTDSKRTKSVLICEISGEK